MDTLLSSTCVGDWQAGMYIAGKAVSEKQLDKKKASNRSQYKWMGFGIELAGVIGFFMWLGHLADEKLETQRPWFMLAGFAVAFLGMMYPLVKEAMGLDPQEKSKKNED